MPKIYGSSEIWGDLLVTGSFSILGSASSINTTSLVVSDTIIALGHSQSGSPSLDEGFMFVRGTGATQAFIWDESDDTFALVETDSDHTVVGDISINSYSNLRVGGLTTSTLKMTNGASNGYFLKSNSSGDGSWSQITASDVSGLPGGLTGSGTVNYIPKWSNSSTLSSTSNIYEDSNGLVGIGITTPSATLKIVSQTASAFEINNTTTYIPSGSKYAINSIVGGNGFSSYNYGSYQLVSGASTTNYGSYIQISGTYGNLYGINIYSPETSTIKSRYGLNIGIGTSLSVGAGSDVGVLSAISTTSAYSYGIYLNNYGANTSAKYGSYQSVSGASPINYGIYLQTTQASSNNYGIYNIVTNGGSTPSSQNWGYYTQVSGASITNYGSYIQISGTYGTTNKGFYSLVTSTGQSSIYSMHSNVQTSGTTYAYGLYSQLYGGTTLNVAVFGGIGSSFATTTSDIAGRFIITSEIGTTYTAKSVSHGITVNNDSYSTSSKYGISINTSGGSASTLYGISNLINNNTTSTNTYANFNQVFGTAGTAYGNYNNLNGSSSIWTGYGLFNSITGYSTNFGVYNQLTGATYGSTKYGVYTSITGTGSNYGEYIAISATGPSNYGLYIDSYNATTNNYGIVVNRGDVIFNESGENYSFRVEGNTQSHLLYVDPYRERVYMGTTSSSYLSTIDFVNFTSLAVNTKSASYSIGYYSETSGADLENYGFYNYLGTSKTYNQNTGYATYINLSSATETTNTGFYAIMDGNGNGSDNIGLWSKLQTVGQNNTGLVIDVMGATSANTGITVDTSGASATAIITNRGGVIFNETGGDYDFRVEGDADQNLLFTDASTDRIGVGTASPQYKLQVLGTVSTTGFRMTNGAINGYVMVSNADGVGSWTSSTRDMSFGHSSQTPTNSTTYYIGMIPQLQPTTTNQVSRRIRSPYRGEITSVSIMWSLGANGSSENVTYQIHNITQATSATITSTAQLTGDAHNTYTLGSPLAVSENDDLQIRWVTPVWGTIPTSVIHVITARIRVY